MVFKFLKKNVKILFFVTTVLFFSNTDAKNAICDFNVCDEVTPLMHACQKGASALEEVRQLIKDGASVNDFDYWEFLRGGKTALGYALTAGCPSIEIITVLLDAVADPDSITYSGIHIGPEHWDDPENISFHIRIIPVLTYAIVCSMSDEIIRLFVDRGADVNSPDPIFGGVTPLIAAAALGQVKTVEYLLSMGACKEFQNCDGKMAIDYARAYNHAEIISMLESY